MSRFQSIFEARQEPQPTQEKPQRRETPRPSPAASSRGPGRPPGKRSDPDHVQITAYIRRSTHHAVKLRLLEQGGDKDFSELVEDLLAEWLE